MRMVVPLGPGPTKPPPLGAGEVGPVSGGSAGGFVGSVNVPPRPTELLLFEPPVPVAAAEVPVSDAAQRSPSPPSPS